MITKIGRNVLWFCAAATVVVLVLGIVFSFGTALVAYVVAWILMPEV